MPATLNRASEAAPDLVKREEYLAVKAENRLLQLENQKLKAILYGRSSEKLPPEDPAQLKLLKELDEELKSSA